MLDATNISVLEVLAEFDGSFEAVAAALGNGEFALWIGSGISRGAPKLGDLIDSAVEYVRSRAVDAASAGIYMPVLQEILKMARIEPADAPVNMPFAAWPQYEAARRELWNQYSDLLDLRIRGERSDFILWNAIDIRSAFSHPPLPGAEHLCIAVLILEGAVHSIASANWDGFIEAAVDRLGGSAPGTLQTVVDPAHLRQPAARARLLKFHGCIVHATASPDDYRHYLTGSHTQITDWPNNHDFDAMRAALVEIATNLKTLVMGLSIQDANLQGVFSSAKRVHPWPWPCAPASPAHIFCEDAITKGQRDVLKIVYGDAYNTDMDAIEAASHLRAWAEQVLLALVIKLVETKLTLLMQLELQEAGKGAYDLIIGQSLRRFRDELAASAVGDRKAFTYRAITLWSRALSIYRSGSLPASKDLYEALSASSPRQLPGDQNARASKFGQFGVSLSLLQSGRDAGSWTIDLPVDESLSAGAMTLTPAWPGAAARPIHIVRSAPEAINLQKSGAFAGDNAIVVHGDDTWQLIQGVTSPRRQRAAPGRTGRMTTRHISVGHLVAASSDADGLSHRFIQEVLL